MCAHTHAHLLIYSQTNKHTHIHIYTHKHIHIHTCKLQGSFFEVGTVAFGEEVITGFARLDGRPVGVFANDCRKLVTAFELDATS